MRIPMQRLKGRRVPFAKNFIFFKCRGTFTVPAAIIRFKNTTKKLQYEPFELHTHGSIILILLVTIYFVVLNSIHFICFI